MLLLDSLRDTFRDSHQAADELAAGLQEHMDDSGIVVPLDAGSRALALAVEERLDGHAASTPLMREAPRTVVIVAERIRRIGPVDDLIARVLHAGAERILIGTPLAESAAAYAVDDRADAFVCLRRAPKLGTIGRWYDYWTFTTVRPRSAEVVALMRARRAHAAVRAH